MKYWVLSKRLKEIITNKIDPHLDLKAKLLYYGQTLIILAWLFSSPYVYWDNK
jgi:hypothetical protein